MKGCNMTDTQTDLLAAAKAYLEKLDEIDTAEFGAGAEREEREALEAAIERAGKGTPELDLNDQVEAKRVNECPDCATETDTTRNNGPNGDEYVEYCTNDECEWEIELGTVTESLS